MNFSAELAVFLGGVATGAVILLFTGFFKKAGEDLYDWLMKLVRPPPPPPESLPAQVVVQLVGISPAEGANRPTSLVTTPVDRVSAVTIDEILTR